MPPHMPKPPSFVFMTCQIGAEQALKREVERAWPCLRFAFSRAGFLTFKISSDANLPRDFDSNLVFARAAGYCLGKAAGTTPHEQAASIWKLLGDRKVTRLHVWPRDRYPAGFRDYEPGMTPQTAEIERVVREHSVMRAVSLLPLDHANAVFPKAPMSRRLRTQGEWVADVVVLGDDEWWIGYHEVHSLTSSWPGGFFPAELPSQAVSRAWLKMNEALAWSEFRPKKGERCIEIGSAPGGASQFLLAQGLEVTGIDPANMDSVVLADPHFRHIRKRSKDVPRREFVGTNWLTCDVNLPPNYTLDAVKAVVGYPGVKLKGMLLTMKLVEWSLAHEVPKYIERIRASGFRAVRARQLHHNRQEVCIAASRYRAPR